MTLFKTATHVSVAEANDRGVDALIGEVERGQEFVVVRDGKPAAVVVGFERFEEWQRLRDDLIDITLVTARVMTSDGPGYSLDEVLEHFGYTREALEAMPE